MMSEAAQYPPTSGEILGEVEVPTAAAPSGAGGTEDEAGAPPPPYEEAVKPGDNQTRGKPARPAPPYTPGTHKPHTMYPGYPPSNAYPSNAYPSNAYPSNAYPSNVYPSNAYPSNMYPPPGNMYPPGTTYCPTQHYDQERSISLAPEGHQLYPSHEQQPTIVAGQCHKLEMWLASKTGMRSCMVTLFMGVILAIVCAIIGSSFLTAMFVIGGLCALAMLAWSISLQRQRSKMLAAEEERRINVNRVEIREMGETMGGGGGGMGGGGGAGGGGGVASGSRGAVVVIV